MSRGNGSRKSKPNGPRSNGSPRGSGQRRGKPVHQSNPQHHHGLGIPSWLVSVLVNIVVLAAGIVGTWFTMQSDIGNMKLQINGLNSTINAQIVRIDSMNKEWDRITRLEERLGNVVSLLGEIRNDLRDGRYAVRRDGVITTTPASPNR